MKFIFSKEKMPNILKILIFGLLTVIISYLLPTESSFKYQYEIGKPWSYELMTASFDFPIYKSEAQIESEKKDLLANFAPYFKKDTMLMVQQFNKLVSDTRKNIGKELPHKKLVYNLLKNIYNTGIIASEHIDSVNLNASGTINCIYPDRMNYSLEARNLLTPKTAYELLSRSIPEDLKQYNLNLYLIENLKFDSAKTELSKKELLENLSVTSGVVQFGERIIDRGEIVNSESYLILNSLKKEFDKRKETIQRSAIVIIGEVIIISSLVILLMLYLYLFRPRIYDNFNNIIFICLMILIMTGISSVVIQYSTFSYYVIPFGLLPIIIRVFFDSRTALYAHIITTLIISLMVDSPFHFILIQIIIGMVAVSSLKDMTQRSQLAQTAFIILISYILLHISLEFITEGDINRIHWKPLIYFSVSSAILLFAYLLIYIFEKIFGLISSLTLVELTNINSDLMLQFAEKAPGTFQHTLQVSNLATEAAKKIGANSLLVRTGALYHDIGKMQNPQYFIENQLGGPNPLNELDFETAARKIIGHVTDGVEIAKKHHLPDQIIHFITTHHGKSKTRYFYNSFLNLNPNAMPNEEAYTYPGPLPDSKETAILMMADAVEARSRSLKVYSEESISEMVEQMIDGQIADGQFKDAPISFRDVETVKSVFKDKIKNIYHNRIAYPELKK